MKRWLATALILSAACGVEKPDLHEDFSDLARVDEKSDAFSGRMRIVGSLRYGQTSGGVGYSSPPRYRAFKFAGRRGDKVKAWVRSRNGGDAVAWILDDDFRVLAYNDDASSRTLDAHLSVTLRGDRRPDIVTHYVVFRDYFARRATFTVELRGETDYTSCAVDADCVRVEAGCCPLGRGFAVRADRAEDYRASLGCDARPICPAIAIRDDHGVAQCDDTTRRCTMVKPEDIACGGRRLNPHACPPGFSCVGPALAYDGTGSCYQSCGGIAARPCGRPGDVCVDNPQDGCDPAVGADCGGICRPAGSCGIEGLCMAGYHWDTTACDCVENTTCGGAAGLRCPPGKRCADVLRDGCDPETGGVSCPGTCVPEQDCRTTGCAPGHYCSMCWGVFACIPEGAVC